MKLAVYYDLAYGGAANALTLFVNSLRHRHHVDVFHPPGACPIVTDSRPLSGLGPLPRSSMYYWNRISHPIYFRKLENKERILSEQLRQYDRVLIHSCRGRGAPALVNYMGDKGVFYVTEPLRMYREPRYLDGEPAVLWQVARFLYAPVSTRFNGADALHGSRAGKVLANSKYTATQVMDVYQQNAQVVYPPVDSRFLEGTLGTGEGGYVLSPGALIPVKGHGRVIRAMAELPQPRPPLILAGTPVNRGYVTRILKLAARLGVNMKVHENLTGADYLECLGAAKVIAVGAHREPLGLVSLEAQALGRPVVVVREGGLPETVWDRGPNGVVDPQPEAFAQGIRGVLECSGNDGGEARNWVLEHFSGDRCGKRLEEALCQ